MLSSLYGRMHDRKGAQQGRQEAQALLKGLCLHIRAGAYMDRCVHQCMC